LLYEKIKGVYAGKPREQKMVSVEPNPKLSAPGNPSGLTVNEITRIQFPSQDEKALVAVYRDTISISVLHPYPTWETFRPRIENALNAYTIMAVPAGVRRIGLRYINMLTKDGNIDDLLNYFKFPPTNLSSIQCTVDNFSDHTEYIYDDEPIRVIVNFARTVAPAGKSSCVLDIDVAWEWPGEALPLGQAMKKVDELRSRERVVFETLITDRAREAFDAT